MQFLSMSKIRINELARQLEVPSHVILDMLPDSASPRRRRTPARSMTMSRTNSGADSVVRVAVADAPADEEAEPVSEAGESP